MPINPLAPFLPDPLPYLAYGIITGMLFKPRGWSKNIIYRLFFYYCYLVWLASMYLLMFGQSQTHEAWFIVGCILTFVSMYRVLGSLFRPFSFIAERITEYRQERRYSHPEEQERRTADQAYAQTNRTSQYNSQSQQDILRAEQARREAEMRAYRGQTPPEPAQSQQPPPRPQHSTQNPHQNQNEPRHRHRIENDSRAEPPPQDTRPTTRTTEQRSSEEVLRLVAGWTQEDLKTAYKRESQRTHPDTWIGKPQAMREMMEAEYKAVQEAYRKLKR